MNNNNYPDNNQSIAIEGVASVDESAITGESAPVIRESGGDRSSVTGGTRVLSNWLKVKITAIPGETFPDRMIHLVEGAKRQKTPNEIALTILIPFSAQTRMSWVNLAGNEIRKGVADAIEKYLHNLGETLPSKVREIVEDIAKKGGTPLVVIEGATALGVIYLKDVIKGGIRERFAQLRRMGIKTIMITGDNPITAAAIAAEAGVDDFLAEATPETKLKLIREYQEEGHLVAMTGDGTNDAPALAQADVGVAMNSGTQAAKEAGNMVDLDSNPTKLIEVVETGKQLLITRGSLTTFSIANDVAKYFAIIPAIFITSYPVLGALNIMKLAAPQSAILSAVIFNALIIIALVPLALRGIAYKPLGAEVIIRRNMLIYGLGGLIAPFAGIKLINMLLALLGLS